MDSQKNVLNVKRACHSGSPLSSEEKAHALCWMRRGRCLYPDREVPRPCSCLSIYDLVHESNHTPQRCAVPQSSFSTKEKYVFFFFFLFFLRWSQVMMEDMSCQVWLENCQGFSIPDGGGKFIPPARNGEQKHSGEWFCASLWWHHEATLARRSQTSLGDVNCYKWVEVGGCWACGCSIWKHQCLGWTWALLGSLKTSRAAAF